MPVHKQMVFIGLPENMIAGEQNKTISEIYKSGGAAEVKAAAEFSLEIPVDRYMVFESESFQKLCNIMGGVNFALPGKIEPMLILLVPTLLVSSAAACVLENGSTDNTIQIHKTSAVSCFFISSILPFICYVFP